MKMTGEIALGITAEAAPEPGRDARHINRGCRPIDVTRHAGGGFTVILISYLTDIHAHSLPLAALGASRISWSSASAAIHPDMRTIGIPGPG